MNQYNIYFFHLILAQHQWFKTFNGLDMVRPQTCRFNELQPVLWQNSLCHCLVAFKCEATCLNMHKVFCTGFHILYLVGSASFAANLLNPLCVICCQVTGLKAHSLVHPLTKKTHLSTPVALLGIMYLYYIKMLHLHIT